ncbi:hypothetical protein [uncultured Shewanella sp.]|uniref:hypothetical protein n=1 Tax=uncultured Shewanella sp. TaxID=173975 RepID=UPI00260D255F|nr:hypothetical protein [uncultured Shewanella sp.]
MYIQKSKGKSSKGIGFAKGVRYRANGRMALRETGRGSDHFLRQKGTPLIQRIIYENATPITADRVMEWFTDDTDFIAGAIPKRSDVEAVLGDPDIHIALEEFNRSSDDFLAYLKQYEPPVESEALSEPETDPYDSAKVLTNGTVIDFPALTRVMDGVELGVEVRSSVWRKMRQDLSLAITLANKSHPAHGSNFDKNQRPEQQIKDWAGPIQGELKDELSDYFRIKYNIYL